jgi:hypothetical protein
MKKMGWKEILYQCKMSMTQFVILIFSCFLAGMIISGIVGGITGVILTNL